MRPDHFYAAEPQEFRDYVKKLENEKLIRKEEININPKVRATARRKSIFIKVIQKKFSYFKKISKF